MVRFLCASSSAHNEHLLLQGARGSLSQDLVALWVDEYGPALALLCRIFPAGLMRYLSLKKPAPPALQSPSPKLQAQVCLQLPIVKHQCRGLMVEFVTWGRCNLNLRMFSTPSPPVYCQRHTM